MAFFSGNCFFLTKKKNIFSFSTLSMNSIVVWSYFCYRCEMLCLENLLDTYNDIIKSLEKFLRVFQNEVFFQNFTLMENFKLLRSWPNSDFKVSRILPMFASISENESFILSCFWWHCQELLTSNLLDRYNMIVQCLQMLLITFEKNNSIKKQR